MKFFLFLITFVSFNLYPGIMYKTGDFYLSFSDIDIGNGLNVKRTYNSMGSNGGIFGDKWGSNLESKLYNIAGVMLMVEEIPGGGRHHYLIDSKSDFNDLIDKIIAMKEKRDGRFTEESKNKLKQLMKGSPNVIGEFARMYNIPGEIKLGATYHAIDKAKETIKVVSGGTYIRYRSDAGKDQFNAKGLKIKEQLGGIVINYKHDSEGKLIMVKDSKSRWLKLYYSGSRLIKVVSFSGKTAEYKYNNKGQLVYMKDAKGLVFKHEYDSKSRMLKVYTPSDIPGLSGWWNMKYDDKGRIIYQKDPGAWETFIKYADTATEKEKRKYIEVTKRQGRKNVHQDKYSYVERLNSKGAFYTYKVTHKNNKNYETEVKYNECCSKPLMVNNNGKVTIYKYNSNGSLIKKVLPSGSTLRVKYNGILPTQISQDNLKYFIKYDLKNRISKIGTKNLFFNLAYDRLNRVSSIKDNKGRAITYVYDTTNRLKAIKTKYGNLAVLYDKKGTPIYKPRNARVKAHTKEIFDLQDDYLDTVLILSQVD